MEPTPHVPLYYRHPYSGYRFDSSNAPQFYPAAVPSYPPTTSEDIFDDENQIPSVDEFQAIVDDYLNNLSPKKRDKALVDHNRYYMIQQVLKDPRNTAISTAQFRFWVKKMFQLQPGPNDVVCHDNKPVAIKENIYDILVKAHREAHHGGRDKTSALVRKRYSWIPKELVARFVRHCPYCITRRNSGQSPNLVTAATSAPQARYSNRSSFCFDSGSSIVYTPPAMKEDGSDFSSGPPSSDISYDVSPHYVSMSTTSSPKEPCYTTMHSTKEDEHAQLFYGCHYEHTFQPAFQMPTFLNLQQQQRENVHPTSMHTLGQHQTTTHSYPQTPIFYSQSQEQQQHFPTDYQDYYGPPATATAASAYYCNGLGITHHYQENPSLSSSETTTIHTTTTPNASTVLTAGTTVHATGNSMNGSTANRPATTEEVAAEVAAATAFMQSAANADLLSHNTSCSNNATTPHDLTSSAASFYATATTTPTNQSTTTTAYPFYASLENTSTTTNNSELNGYHHPQPLDSTGSMCLHTARQ